MLVVALLAATALSFLTPQGELQSFGDSNSGAYAQSRRDYVPAPATSYYVDPSFSKEERKLLLDAMKVQPADVVKNFTFIDSEGVVHANRRELLEGYETWTKVEGNTYRSPSGEVAAFPDDNAEWANAPLYQAIEKQKAKDIQNSQRAWNRVVGQIGNWIGTDRAEAWAKRSRIEFQRRLTLLKTLIG